MKRMKNLKMFAIALLSMLVMVSGVHASMTKDTVCETKDGVMTCKFTEDATFAESGLAKDQKVLIDAGGYKVEINSSFKLERGSNLTIKNGQLVLKDSANVTIEKGATLKVTGVNGDPDGDKDTGAVNVTATNAKITINGGTLEISDNESKGIFVGKSVNLEMTLTSGASLKLNNNKFNAMNGVGSTGYVKASDSTIEAKNNKEGGLNAKFELTSTTITATGNGYSGVTFGGNSSIDDDSKVVATGNLVKGDAKSKDKADVEINTSLTVEGIIEADTIAPLKLTYGNGNVQSAEITLDDGTITVKETKAICAGANSFGASCDDQAKAITITEDASKGALVVGGTATVYGAAKVSFGSNVKKVVVKAMGADVTIAPGTEVENASTGKIFVTLTNGTVSGVDAGQKATIGEAVNPDDQQGNTGDANTPGTTNPDVPNVPKTNDNILVYAGLGLVSAISVGFTTRRKENN